jgi:Tol biopolymer transport system component
MKLKTLAAAALLLAPATLYAQATTIRVSWDGSPGGWKHASGASDLSESTFLSSNGRFAAFVTDLRNVDDNHDAPGEQVIVLKDFQGDDTYLVTYAMSGFPNGPSFAPTVTTDGRYVCFTSYASNIVPNDTNQQGDVFRLDRQTNAIARVTVPYDGIEDQYDDSYCVTHAMSDDGRYIVFTSASNKHVPGDTNNSDDVFVRDMALGTTALVSRSTTGGFANGGSMEPRISRDGRYVTFMSFATNLVPGITTPAIRIYVRDLQAATTTLVGEGGLPVISGSGRYVLYTTVSFTGADCQVYRFDLQTKTANPVSVAPDGVTVGNRDSIASAISDDGRFACFISKARNLVPGDTNNESDVFVRDMNTGTTVMVSVAKDGLLGSRASGFADMTADGKYVLFTSACEDFVSLDLNNQPDVFVRGPLYSTLSLADAISAIRIAGGKAAASGADLAALNVVTTGASAGKVDIADATRIARMAAGLN